MLRFLDNYDYYTTNAQFAKIYTSFNGSPAPQSGKGRFSTAGLEHTANTFWALVLDAQASWYLGAAIRLDPTQNSNGTDPLLSLYDGSSRQVELRVNTSRRLLITRNGTTLGTGTTILTPGVTYYLEFGATIHNSTGIAVARINEAVELNLSGVDTQDTANATADKIEWLGNGNGSDTMRFDDVYICDGTGGVADTFLGDTRVEAIFPNGNGNTSNLVGQDSNSTDNYLNVDETSPDDDTTYNESSTIGDKDTYAYTNLTPTTGTVHGIQIMPWAKKTDAGTRKIATIARHSGTEVDSSDFTLSSDYQYFRDVRVTKPGGGSWSISDINNAEFGAKVTA